MITAREKVIRLKREKVIGHILGGRQGGEGEERERRIHFFKAGKHVFKKKSTRRDKIDGENQPGEIRV